MRKLFLLLTVFGSFFRSFAQKELIAEFPILYNPNVIDHTISNDTLGFYLRNWSDATYYTLDLNSNALTSFQEIMEEQSNIQSVGTAKFFTSMEYAPNGNDKRYYINYQKFDGERFKSVTINGGFNMTPEHSVLFNGVYYVNGYMNNKYTIWKSDGTAAGTEVVAQHNSPVQSIDVVDDKLIYTVKTASDFEIYSYSVSGTIALIGQLPVTGNFSYLSPVSSGQSRLFFRYQSTSSNVAIWATDPANSSVSLFIDHCNGINVRLNGTQFFIDIYDEISGLWEKNIGELSNPEVLTAIPNVYDNGFTPAYNQRLNQVHGIYLESLTHEKGRELAYRKPDESIHIVKDFIPGSGSGFVRPMAFENDSVLYTIQSVGAKPFLCKIVYDSITPLFHFENFNEVKYAFIHGSYIYWYEYVYGQPTKLFRRSFADSDPIDINPEDSLTWYKEIAAMPMYSPESSFLTNVYNEGVFIDQNDAVISAFTNPQIIADKYVIENGTGEVEVLRGRDVVTKRDKYGNLVWLKSFGDNSSFTDQGLMTKTTNDDVLVLNEYSYKAYFDSDSMNNDYGNYLVKLNNEDGSILWAKDLFPYPAGNEYVVCDGVVSDEQGNVYLSFLYYGFHAMLEDYEVSSLVSPTNALAKLDSNGTVLWVQNIPTPWTDSYGYTTVLKWNQEKQTILAVQTQARYNTWSSCNYSDYQTFVQTIDTLGTVVDSYNYVADDLSGVMTGEILPDNSYFLSGYFRGHLNIGDYSTVSEPTSNCFLSEGYQLSYSAESGSPYALIRSYEKGFYPLNSVQDEGFVYVLGSDNEDNLKIVRFTDLGVYSGFLPLNQYQDVSEFRSRHNYLDVQNGFIVVQSQSFRPDSVYNVYPYMTTITTESNLLKIENKGWIMDDYFDRQSLPTNTFLNWSSELNVIAYPNPFENWIKLQFKSVDHGYDSYELYDLNGRIVTSGLITKTALEQSIEVGLIGNGMYTLRLLGSERSDVLKLVHSNQ